MFLVGTFYTKRKIMYNGYQTLVMHNPFSRLVTKAPILN